MLYRVTEFKKGKLIVIEGNNILMPRIEFSFVKVKEVLCKMTITVSFKRLSYFFQVSKKKKTLYILLFYISWNSWNKFQEFQQ